MSRNSGRVYYKHNRVKQLRAFCFAAQSGSISKAAERLYLSQPSVSLQIQALERELGITLFERRGPRIRLTPDGRTLYELALPLVDGIDALPEQFLQRNESLQSGRLDIAAGESSTLYILPELLRDYMHAYPKVRIKLHHVAAKDMLAVLRNDQVDFAVGSMLDLPDDIMYKAVYSYGLSLITPPDHPLARKPEITLEDIAEQDLILPPRHLSTWRMVNLVFQQHSIPYKVRLEVGSWETVKRYVAMGFGVSVASDICLSGDEPLAVRPIPEAFPRRTYGIISRRGKFLSPQAKRFIEMMKPDFFETTGGSLSDDDAEAQSVFIGRDTEQD
ncbi:LysR family transcriptional regulator [Alkalilimnicola sp. S0819]|uniref:LysR family transcriptional regulator n=1 Tax=Alkalilimnicola sp. S0819 TaxID=2613922 RepID=UPI0012625EED|nr:LysR family transcriptional regulator [Alkalilimnicola sp. S0819]KAB7627510.1 LysR family transcriptional regulator [Alkalilimnicola sp. S0819]MPQ15664.1 LysR family transcriptional regulator [Alkalilimnicola sp. S0819]